MVIDSQNGINPAAAGNARGRTPAGGVAPGAGGNRGETVEKPDRDQESVSLSPEARSLNRLEAGINAAPDVDADKVESIKQALADGRYKIDAERIAERLLTQDDLFG